MDREIWRGKDVGYIVKKKMTAAVGKNWYGFCQSMGIRKRDRAVKKERKEWIRISSGSRH